MCGPSTADSEVMSSHSDFPGEAHLFQHICINDFFICMKRFTIKVTLKTVLCTWEFKECLLVPSPPPLLFIQLSFIKLLLSTAEMYTFPGKPSPDVKFKQN